MDQQAATQALVRLVDHLLAHAADHDDLDHLIQALDIVQALCWQSVRWEDIPEPTGMNAVQKALAACVVERLVEVYSAPPHNLRQQASPWCAPVPPSPVRVWLISPIWADGARLNSICLSRNIMALENCLSFA